MLAEDGSKVGTVLYFRENIPFKQAFHGTHVINSFKVCVYVFAQMCVCVCVYVSVILWS